MLNPPVLCTMHTVYNVMLLSDVPRREKKFDIPSSVKDDFQINEKLELMRLTPNECEIEFWLECLIGYAVKKVFRKFGEAKLF